MNKLLATRSPLEFKTPIPVTVELSFLLPLAYLGCSIGSGMTEMLIVAVVATFSVLWHELGHALVARAFGFQPRITLLAYGGNTDCGKGELSFWRGLAFAVSGPLASFLLAGLVLAYGYVTGPSGSGRVARYLDFAAVSTFAMNLTWGVANLFPAMPLDGGHVVRHTFLRVFPERGVREVYVWSMVASIGLVIWAVDKREWGLAAAAFFLIVTNVDVLMKLRVMTDEELRPENQRVIQQVIALDKERKWEEAYGKMLLLEPILGAQNTCVLAILACVTGHYDKAAQLCERLHSRLKRDWSVAFLVARAHAGRGDAGKAAEWLRKSVAEGLPNAAGTVSACREFDGIKNESALQAVLHPLGKHRLGPTAGNEGGDA